MAAGRPSIAFAVRSLAIAEGSSVLPRDPFPIFGKFRGSTRSFKNAAVHINAWFLTATTGAVNGAHRGVNDGNYE